MLRSLPTGFPENKNKILSISNLVRLLISFVPQLDKKLSKILQKHFFSSSLMLRPISWTVCRWQALSGLKLLYVWYLQTFFL
jgi:hypothetical protein